MGTLMAPDPRTPRSAMFHSAEVSPMMATRSPGFTPSEASPSATSRTRRPNSFQDTFCHAPPRLKVMAVASGRRSTCSSKSCTRFLDAVTIGWSLPASGSAILLPHRPGHPLRAPLLRRVVLARLRGEDRVEELVRLGGVVLLEVQLGEVDLGAQVPGEVAQRLAQVELALLPVVLGPGKLVEVAPPRHVGAVP